VIRAAVAVAILSGAVVLIPRAGWDSGPPAAIGGKKRTTAKAASVQPATSDAAHKLVLGTWEDDYQGSRTLTVRPDGTATMEIEFDGWKARMFTRHLTIETTWTIDDGHFNRQTVGGEPADKVEFVKRRVGDRASDKIVKLTADRMILIDQDGETRYEWRRVR
jgi:hypothetical protein